MRLRVLAAVSLLALFLVSPSCKSSLPVTTAPQPRSRSYYGTASVGDFMNITMDSRANTITYKNLSNGDSGVVPYSLNSDGTYALNDPTGNLIAAYEIPGYAMLIAAEKAGSDHA